MLRGTIASDGEETSARHVAGGKGERQRGACRRSDRESSSARTPAHGARRTCDVRARGGAGARRRTVRRPLRRRVSDPRARRGRQRVLQPVLDRSGRALQRADTVAGERHHQRPGNGLRFGEARRAGAGAPRRNDTACGPADHPRQPRHPAHLRDHSRGRDVRVRLGCRQRPRAAAPARSRPRLRRRARHPRPQPRGPAARSSRLHPER